MSASTLPTPELAALLGAALVAAGQPAAAAVAPAVLLLFVQFIERHVAGEPLPEILRATMPNDSAVLAAERERTE